MGISIKPREGPHFMHHTCICSLVMSQLRRRKSGTLLILCQGAYRLCWVAEP